MFRDSSIGAARAGTYRLGAHDVARVGYGAMQLHRRADTPAVAFVLLRRAIAVGINHLDTAQFYNVASASISFDEETLAELDAIYTKAVQVTDGGNI